MDIVGGYTMRGLAGTHNGDRGVPGRHLAVSDILAGALGTSYNALFNQRFMDASIGVSVESRSGAGRRTAIWASPRRSIARRRSSC